MRSSFTLQLSQFWLTLKLFLGHSWQSSLPPTTIKVSARRPSTKLRRGTFKQELCSRPAVPRSQQSSRHFTQAEGATPRSSGVCVLDFISRVNAPETNAERGGAIFSNFLKLEISYLSYLSIKNHKLLLQNFSSYCFYQKHPPIPPCWNRRHPKTPPLLLLLARPPPLRDRQLRHLYQHRHIIISSSSSRHLRYPRRVVWVVQ